MSWYRAGSVTVAAGSNVVTGAGTDFVANVWIGDAFVGQDGRSYEVGQIISAADLRLTTPYQGAGGAGQAYAIQPTQSFARDLALAAATLLGTFAAVRDGVGQGLFPDGSVAAPGMRFAADQDTGWARLGDNRVAMVAGGAARVTASPDGLSVTGHVAAGNSGGARIGYSIGETWTLLGDLIAHYGMTVGVSLGGGDPKTVVSGYAGLILAAGGAEQVRITPGGNLLVGVTSASNHVVSRGTSEGDLIMQVQGKAHPGVAFFSAASGSANGSACTFALNKNSQTNRSINAAGTINGSGADYAEYMIKAAGCGIIAKGDVCGVDRDGKLTTAWADAISFVVKSTDPSLVGGDTWAAHLPPRPDAPGAEPQPPTLPAAPAEDADDAALEAYRDDLAGYPARVAQYQVDHAAWTTAQAQYEADLSAWEADLEAARQCVDRIAFCGQVPCHVSGDFEVGDYIVAAQDGDGINAVAVKADAITLPQYMARIGKVWAIREGRAWIDVQHG